MIPTEEELRHLIALRSAPGIGDQLLKTLVEHFGSAEELFRIPRGRLLRVPGIGPRTATAIQSITDLLKQADRELKLAQERQTRILPWTDPAYPRRLHQIHDAPAILYRRGPAHLDHPRLIGIVGTRRITHYGRRVVEEFVEELAALDCIVVSGLAYGVDIQAHRQALQRGMTTVAVMGSGADVIYPADHRETALEMLQLGALLSELPMGTRPESHHFPARNRIIAGLCDALLVIEAASTGGALITAALADSYHRDVFAVPGNIHEPYSCGCNQLIRSNLATMVTTGQELTDALNWNQPLLAPDPTTIPTPTAHDSEPGLSLNSSRIWKAFDGHHSLPLEQIRFITSLPHGELAAGLLDLELLSMIEPTPGNCYRVIRRR